MKTLADLGSIAIFLAAAAVVTAASGCDDEGGEASSDTDTDSDVDGGADAGDGGDNGICPDPTTEDCAEPELFGIPIQAAVFGEGVSFVSASRNFLLARVGEGEEACVAAYPFECQDSLVWSAAFLESSLPGGEPVAIYSCTWTNEVTGYCGYCDPEVFESSLGVRAVALLCDGEDCSLWGTAATPSEGAPLVPLEWGDLSGQGRMRGLYSVDGLLCVYGAGIFCFDGEEWATELEAEAGVINDMDCAGSIGSCYAAGQDGLYIRTSLSEPGEWETPWMYVSSGEDLLSVSWAGDAVSAGGLVSGWMLGSGVSCPMAEGTGPVAIAQEPSASDLPDVPLPASRIVLGDGRIVRYAYDPDWGQSSCFSAQVEGEVLDVFYLGCETSDNALVLTREGLYGESMCE